MVISPGLTLILLYDNARLHITHTVQDLLGSMIWKALQHPPYNLDLSPCDSHAFGPLKESLIAFHFKRQGRVKSRKNFTSRESIYHCEVVLMLMETSFLFIVLHIKINDFGT